MRLFISINFDDKTKKNISNVQNMLKQQGPGHFTNPDRFHLTLAFLGEKTPKDLEKIKELLKEVKMPKITLTFSKLNCFSKDDETWWIGVDENKELIDFQNHLAEILEANGLYKREKKFVPHITLARGMKTGKLKFDIGTFSFETNSFSVMRSQRVKGQLSYTKEYERIDDVRSLSFR